MKGPILIKLWIKILVGIEKLLDDKKNSQLTKNLTNCTLK